MPDESEADSSGSPSQADILDLLLAEYLRAREAGQQPDRLALLAQHPQLKRELGEFFANHDRFDRLAGPAFEPTVAPDTDVAPHDAHEQAGSMIGPYKLLEQIGEGGMGAVYMADQQVPVRRRVALKIIKPGMDTRQVIARFEAERQALALMDHPNIAKVLDVGTTESGRPYFVMELVRGIPITKYCDQNNLTLAERLELFIAVCQAVQHAHQKGIIHRDIKPSNALVTLHEGKPVPKVIDFGLAKATNQQLTDKTLFTKFAQMVGTPLYMSPEQAEMSGLDVDTRTDIYSLGVILYELLTGTTPYSRERLREAGLDEIRRIIREEDPLRPSTRISTLGDTRVKVAGHRKSDPGRLAQFIRGDLDWIVMKALEKDRTRRYETANGLARDVERFLTDEPVEACPPSATYRFRKFARRNRVVLTTGVVVSAALVLGIAVSTWQAVRATIAERAADTARLDEAQQRKLAQEQRTLALASAESARQAEKRADQKAEEAIASAKSAEKEKLRATDEAEKATRVAQFLASMFEASAPQKHMGIRFTGVTSKNAQDPTSLAARQLLDRGAQKIVNDLKDQPSVQAALMDTIGNVYIGLGLVEEAQPLLEGALEIRRRLHSAPHVDIAASYQSLALLRSMQFDSIESITNSRQALAMREQLLDADHPDIIDTKFFLAVAVATSGYGLGEAQGLLEEVLAWRRTHLGTGDRETAYAMIMLAATLIMNRSPDDAAPLLNDATAVLMRDPVAKPLGMALSEALQSVVLVQLGQTNRAVISSAKAVEHFREFEADDHPLFFSVAMMHVGILMSADRQGDAKKFCRDQFKRIRDRGRSVNPAIAAEFAEVLSRDGNLTELDEAESLCRESLQIVQKIGKKATSVELGLVGALAKVLAVRASQSGEMSGLEEAEGLYQKALSIGQELEAPPTASFVVLLNNVARPLGRRDPTRAEALYQRAVEVAKESATRQRESKAGNKPDLAPLADIVEAFASALRGNGKRAEAEGVCRDALTFAREQADEFCTMRLTKALADLNQEHEQFAEAERLYRESLQLTERIRRMKPNLGERWTSDVLRHLGKCLAAQGKPAEAEEMYRKAIAVGDPVLTTPAKAELVGLLCGRGATDEALAVLQSALVLDKDESYTSWVRKWRNLHDVLGKESSKATLATALGEAERILADARKRLGDGSADVATILVNVGVVLSEQGECQRAEPLLREGVEIRRNVLPPDAWPRSSAEVVLGECLIGVGRFDEAEQLLLSAHSHLASTRGSQDFWAVKAAEQIVRLYYAWEKPEKAEEYRKSSAPPASLPAAETEMN